MSTEGAYRMDLVCNNLTGTNLRGEYQLQYKPQEPGIYLLNIKYGDDHISGAPLMTRMHSNCERVDQSINILANDAH